MPVPIPGSKVKSDNQKVKILTIFGRPKTMIFGRFRGVPGRAPLATNHAALFWGVSCMRGGILGISWGVSWRRPLVGPWGGILRIPTTAV